MKITIILLLSVLSLVNSSRLPSNFKKCNRKQEDLKKCVLEAVENAVPQLIKEYREINIPSLNPLKVKEATVKKGQGTVAVDQNFKNCDFYGFEKMKFDKFEFDFEKKTLHVVGVFPEIIMKCQYSLSGNVLLLPIEGEGPSTIILRDLQADCLLHYEETQKHGKTYIKMVSTELNIDPSLVSFDFENLFNGDKALGDNINKVLNDNWKEVFEDVKSDYIEIVKSILLNLLNNFFAKVSMEEAFD